MYVGVLLHVGLLVKSFATEGAGVGPSVRVNEQVCRQGAAPLESFATLRTLKQELRSGTLEVADARNFNVW